MLYVHGPVLVSKETWINHELQHFVSRMELIRMYQITICPNQLSTATSTFSTLLQILLSVFDPVADQQQPMISTHGPRNTDQSGRISYSDSKG